MAFKLPERRIPVRQIQIPQERFPTEQYIRAYGQHPLSSTIDAVGQAIGKSLADKREQQKLAAELSAIAQAGGTERDRFKDIREPKTALSLLEMDLKREEMGAKRQEEKRKQSLDLFTPDQLKSLYSGSPEKMIQAFPEGVPRQAASLGMSGLRAERLEDERGSRRTERIRDRVLAYSESMERNPRLKAIESEDVGLRAADTLVALTRAGNSIAGNALGMKMGRGLGEVGVMTDADVTRYVTSGKLTRKAGDVLNRWLNGVPTEATVDEIAQISATLKDHLNEKRNEIRTNYVDRLARNYDMPREEAAFLLAVDLPSEKPTLAPLPTPGKSQQIGGYVVEEVAP